MSEFLCLGGVKDGLHIEFTHGDTLLIPIPSDRPTLANVRELEYQDAPEFRADRYRKARTFMGLEVMLHSSLEEYGSAPNYLNSHIERVFYRFLTAWGDIDEYRGIHDSYLDRRGRPTDVELSLGNTMLMLKFMRSAQLSFGVDLGVRAFRSALDRANRGRSSSRIGVGL